MTPEGPRDDRDAESGAEGSAQGAGDKRPTGSLGARKDRGAERLSAQEGRGRESGAGQAMDGDAEALYAEYLRRLDAKGIDFEDFVRAHPARADALRALRSIDERPGTEEAQPPGDSIGGDASEGESRGEGAGAGESGPHESGADKDGAARGGAGAGNAGAGNAVAGSSEGGSAGEGGVAARGPGKKVAVTSFLEHFAAGAQAHPQPADILLGDSVENYKLIEVVGEGGFGAVFRAEQERPLRRTVALKVLKLGMANREIVARFETERQALALMSHPSIAKIFDAGLTRSGRPYFAMEFIPGVPITEYCDKEALGVRERLDLFLPVCEAVQHAHQKAVIHRDIKPSNVLTTVESGRPLPKIIDFGIAKATGPRLTERTLYTELGQLIGTPAYMSPEQAEMSGLDIDTRTDIYSLGVLLYELLAGVLPFDPETFRRSSYVQLQRIICEEDPPRPSTRVFRLAQEEGAEKGELRRRQALARQLRGDLDWIVMKAMAKDRTMRYATASELAADIRRHLRDEPVLAGPPGLIYRLRKLVRRHRFAAAGCLAVVFCAAAVAGALYVKSESLFRGGLRDAGLALQARDLAGARNALSALLRSHPERSEVKSLEGEVASLEEAILSEKSLSLLGEAGETWDRYQGLRGRLDDLERAWKAQILEQPSWTPPWEREREFEIHEEFQTVGKEVQDAYGEALVGFQRAIETAPRGSQAWTEAREALAGVYKSMHELAVAEGAVTFGADHFRRQGTALDPDAFAEKDTRILLRTDPPEAAVYCFRFVEQEKRLVPVPFSPQSRSVPTGVEPFLRVESVTDTSLCAFVEGDRLLEVGGKPVRLWGDLAKAVATVDAGARISVLLERGGKKITESWVPFPAERYRDGEEGRLRPGRVLSFREQFGFTLSAYSLNLREDCTLKAADAPSATSAPSGSEPSLKAELEVSLPEGSYLLVVRKRGYVEARLPILAAGGKIHAEVELTAESDAPPGFVFVPAGSFLCGGDPKAFQGLPLKEHLVEGFFIGRLEVTFADYVEFLDDPLEPIDDRGEATPASPDVLRYARSRLGKDKILLVPRWDKGQLLASRGADGRWTWTEAVESERWPVFGVSQLAAQEYTHWLTVRSGRGGTDGSAERTERAGSAVGAAGPGRGGGWRYRLPTDVEWEKAARGADRRILVWGDYPVWCFSWTNRGIFRQKKKPEEVGVSPADESVYGVRDMAGSVSEHALGMPSPLFRFTSVRGGNWFSTDEDYGRLASRNGCLPENAAVSTGFRLVAERMRAENGKVESLKTGNEK